MSLYKLPMLNERIRLATDHFQASTEHANSAQRNVDMNGTLIGITQMDSKTFQVHFPGLSSLHSVPIALYGLGPVHLLFGNLNYRVQLLTLKAFYDHLYAFHSTRASNLDLSLLTLLALRNKVLLRAQGLPATPLSDLVLGSN
jgi:hypothetical protein